MSVRTSETAIFYQTLAEMSVLGGTAIDGLMVSIAHDPDMQEDKVSENFRFYEQSD